MALGALTALLSIQSLQSTLKSFESATKFSSFVCPLDVPIKNITSMREFDYIIVGAGTAGSVLLNRLSECPAVSVLVLEAGGCPGLEALLMGFFAFEPRGPFDFNYPSVDDNHALQNLQGEAGGITIGKMLGGTSCLHHSLHVRGDVPSFDRWGKAVNDSSWSFDGLLPYFIKNERVKDKAILKKYRKYHGTTGNIKVKRQIDEPNDKIFDAYQEMGYKKRIDTNNYNPFGVVEPLLEIGDTYRQCGLTSYIAPVKDRPNLYILTGATVSKIVIEDKKATGVMFSYKGLSYTVKSKKEVILSAGAIISPQILMLSGIGPAEHLKSKNIPLVADLPVGRNLQDHPSVVLLFQLAKDLTLSTNLDQTKFPAPITCNYANLDDPEADFAQCQGINLVIPQISPGLQAICLNAFKYKLEKCKIWFDANIGRKVLFSYNTRYSPVSRGSIKLRSTNIYDPPIVNIGYLSKKEDVVGMGKCLANTARILNTTYFKEVGGKLVDMGVCLEHEKFSDEYWQCYGVAMSTMSWHFCATAAMGSVVDTNLQVIGIKGLRVVDASVIPIIPNAKLIATVYALAEKAADIIRSDHEDCCS